MVKNILVTGGAGYIGSHTVVELVSAGYRPIIVDDLSNSRPTVIEQLEALVRQKLTFYRQRYQDEPKMRQLLKAENIDGVIHFAAFKAVGESVEQPLKYYRNNVGGLIKLLELFDEASVERLVFSSSCTVYGEPDQLPVTEAAPLKPAESPYGATKQIGEQIIRDTARASGQLRALALRYFNPIGAHPSALIGELPLGTPANLVPFLTQTAAGQRPALTVFGNDYPTPDGTCIRDYIHVVDLARAHVAALKHLEKQAAGSFDFCNIGTGTGSSVLEVIKTFEQATSQKVPYKIGPRRDGDIVQSYAAVDKAQQLLGWQAKLSLADALRDAWRWQEKLGS